MRQDDVMLFIEALCTAGCLLIDKGEYPTVSITELGNRVMREQERIQLAIPEGGHGPRNEEDAPPKTAFQTLALYRQGFSVVEIATQRGLVTNTIESHLEECLRAGLPVDISKLVSAEARARIEQAIDEHGTEKLKPIRESLPEDITYNQIRFVVADRLRTRAAQ
jgi:ATP-dependent DNA helicase RecQ